MCPLSRDRKCACDDAQVDAVPRKYRLNDVGLASTVGATHAAPLSPAWSAGGCQDDIVNLPSPQISFLVSSTTRRKATPCAFDIPQKRLSIPQNNHSPPDPHRQNAFHRKVSLNVCNPSSFGEALSTTRCRQRRFSLLQD